MNHRAVLGIQSCTCMCTCCLNVIDDSVCQLHVALVLQLDTISLHGMTMVNQPEIASSQPTFHQGQEHMIVGTSVPYKCTVHVALLMPSTALCHVLS